MCKLTKILYVLKKLVEAYWAQFAIMFSRLYWNFKDLTVRLFLMTCLESSILLNSVFMCISAPLLFTVLVVLDLWIG